MRGGYGRAGSVDVDGGAVPTPGFGTRIICGNAISQNPVGNRLGRGSLLSFTTPKPMAEHDDYYDGYDFAYDGYGYDDYDDARPEPVAAELQDPRNFTVGDLAAMSAGSPAARSLLDRFGRDMTFARAIVVQAERTAAYDAGSSEGPGSVASDLDPEHPISDPATAEIFDMHDALRDSAQPLLSLAQYTDAVVRQTVLDGDLDALDALARGRSLALTRMNALGNLVAAALKAAHLSDATTASVIGLLGAGRALTPEPDAYLLAWVQESLGPLVSQAVAAGKHAAIVAIINLARSLGGADGANCDAAIALAACQSSNGSSAAAAAVVNALRVLGVREQDLLRPLLTAGVVPTDVGVDPAPDAWTPDLLSIPAAAGRVDLMHEVMRHDVPPTVDAFAAAAGNNHPHAMQVLLDRGLVPDHDTVGAAVASWSYTTLALSSLRMVVDPLGALKLLESVAPAAVVLPLLASIQWQRALEWRRAEDVETAIKYGIAKGWKPSADVVGKHVQGIIGLRGSSLRLVLAAAMDPAQITDSLLRKLTVWGSMSEPGAKVVFLEVECLLRARRAEAEAQAQRWSSLRADWIVFTLFGRGCRV